MMVGERSVVRGDEDDWASGGGQGARAGAGEGGGRRAGKGGRGEVGYLDRFRWVSVAWPGTLPGTFEFLTTS